MATSDDFVDPRVRNEFEASQSLGDFVNAYADGFAAGLNVHDGAIMHPQVAEALDLPLVTYPRAA